MNYLFFDIEAANPKLRTIATFGYVLTDENFKVIEKDDILMNPDSKYDWYVAENLLSYSKKTLAANPKFDQRYEKIKALLENTENIVCGYSIANDLNYINGECIRYSLPSIEFEFFDIQMLADAVFESKNQIGIERAYSLLGIKDEIIIHRSDEDALAAMKVAKVICEAKNISLKAISSVYRFSGQNRGFSYTFHTLAPNT